MIHGNFKKVRKATYDIVVVADDDNTNKLFIHCNNGKSEATTRDFNASVLPLMKLHGVCSWGITDATKD